MNAAPGSAATASTTIGSPWLMAGFFTLVGIILVLDLGVLNRKSKVPTPRSAALWSLFCVSLALAFNGWLYFRFGGRPALEFFTGYLIEYALSVDNLFVFLYIFSYFAVALEHQHRVLFWGILGAIALRGVFILIGNELVARFEWAIYVFGAFLVVTAIKMMRQGDEQPDLDKNAFVRLFRRFVPLSPRYDGERFLTQVDGRTLATPLLLVLVVIDVIDVVFALDSIPAVLGVTKDPTIVLTSNVFAILGLRALYFLLASVMDRFRLLKYGVAGILAFVGGKMLLEHFLPIPIPLSLGVIVVLLLGSIVASVAIPPRTEEPQ
jgi:tellurite resistance protein TerC